MTIIVSGSGLTFLDAVNRVLRINGFIRGDTDVLTAFTDTNHNATSNIAQIAIQSEILELASNALLPYEKADGTITAVTNQRTYTLASDFVRLFGDQPFFLDATQNYQIFQYPGGEDKLRNDVINYKSQYGSPNWFYFEQQTTKAVSFFLIPDSSINGRVFSYAYEKSVTPILSTDLMPFQRDDEVYAFCDAASRRFKYLYEGKNDIPVEQDPVYKNATARLMQLIKGKNSARRYGKTYV